MNLQSDFPFLHFGENLGSFYFFCLEHLHIFNSLALLHTLFTDLSTVLQPQTSWKSSAIFYLHVFISNLTSLHFIMNWGFTRALKLRTPVLSQIPEPIDAFQFLIPLSVTFRSIDVPTLKLPPPLHGLCETSIFQIPFSLLDKASISSPGLPSFATP